MFDSESKFRFYRNPKKRIPLVPGVGSQTERMSHIVYQQTISALLADASIDIPAHQRPYVWDHARAQKFIETILEGLPTHSLFMYEEVVDGDIKHWLEDGQQRWFTVVKFVTGEFGDKVTYAGRVYANLSEDEKNAIMNYKFVITMMKRVPIEKRLELFQRLQDGKPLTNGQRFHACRTNMDVVKFAEKIVSDPAGIALWGAQKETPTKLSLANAMAIASGVCYADPNTIVSSYDILGKKMFGQPTFDLEMAEVRYQKLLDVYKLADVLCPPTAAMKKKQWKVGTYTGYILYTMIADGRDWAADSEMWAKYIARVRKEPSAAFYLNCSKPSSRNWTAERWEKGLANVHRAMTDPTWIPTGLATDTDSDDE